MRQTPASLPLIIERSLDIRQLPLSSQLFAGAWLRFDQLLDEDIVRHALRLLVPRGLMIVVAPPRADLGSHLHDMPIEGDSQSPEVKILGNALIKVPSRRLKATLLVRLEARNDKITQFDCRFCPPSRFDVNKQANLPGASAVLWGDEEFLAIPDVAPIEPGHLLLVSTKHWFSMGAMPHSSYEFLERHASRLERTIELGFGKKAIFIEHGATRPHEAGSCIDHAHWHCLPDSGTVMDNLERAGMRGVNGPLMRAKEFYERRKPYFLVRKNGEHWFFPGTGLPCQFLRLIASHSGILPNSRWQHVVNSQNNCERYADTLRYILPAADAVLRETSIGSYQHEVLPEETMGA